MLILEDGQVAYGDCNTVQYPEVGGRDPLFITEKYIPIMEKYITPELIGLDIDNFRQAAEKIDNFKIENREIHKAISYGVTQALLDASAKSKKITMCELIKQEYNINDKVSYVPIFGQTGDERYQNIDKMIIKGVDVMPHGLINNVEEKLGKDGEKLIDFIKWIKETAPVCVRSTFLGAHAIPAEYKSNVSRYVDLVINEMIPQVASEELSDFIDVFCDQGFFSVEDTERILMAGIKHGLRPKIHANELGLTGGVQAGVKYNALSVDHLEHMGEAEFEALRGTETMPTVLPGAAFFLNMKLSPVRKMMEAGLPVALASDYNPGSSPSGNMNFISSLACIKYNMLPEEVINATTLNSAYAMGISDRLGSVARGKTANLFITSDMPGIEYLPYRFAADLIETVILNGEIQNF